MPNDTRQLLYELQLTLLTMLPNTDSTKLKLRFEEIIQNYEITKNTEENLGNDLQEKIDLYINIVTVEGFSISTTGNGDCQKCLSYASRMRICRNIFSTGCRLSEVSGMKKAAIYWNSGSLAVIGKDNKERIV